MTRTARHRIAVDEHRAEEQAPIASARSLPSMWRLITLAVLLPAIVAAANQMLVSNLSPTAVRWCFYPFIALSIAILGWCVGRYLSPSWLGWLIFGWSLLLLDAMTIAMCLNGPVEQHFGYTLVTAQVCLVVLWAILGPVGWQWRLPVVLAAIAMIIQFMSIFSGGPFWWQRSQWAILMLITSVVMALLCASLRIARFSLRLRSTATSRPEPAAIFQFGIQHLLIWSAALVPLLVVGRAVGASAFRGTSWQGFFPTVALAVSLAAIGLIAIWTALGRSHWLLSIFTLIAAPVLAAFAMQGLTKYVYPQRAGNWYNAMDYVLFEAQGTWISWMPMYALLLAALLLFLRAKGYQLVRIQPLG